MKVMGKYWKIKSVKIMGKCEKRSENNGLSMRFIAGENYLYRDFLLPGLILRGYACGYHMVYPPVIKHGVLENGP